MIARLSLFRWLQEMEYVEEDGCQRFGWANATQHVH